MGNKSKKNLDDLKKDLQIMTDEDMNRVKGGKKTSNKWNPSCGGIIPQ